MIDEKNFRNSADFGNAAKDKVFLNPQNAAFATNSAYKDPLIKRMDNNLNLTKHRTGLILKQLSGY